MLSFVVFNDFRWVIIVFVLLILISLLIITGQFCSSFYGVFFCVVLLCVFTFWVPCCDVRYYFRIKRCSVRLFLQLMSYLRYLCLFAYSGVQQILWCVGFFCLPLEYPMLPVSRDCTFSIAPSVFFLFSFLFIFYFMSWSVHYQRLLFSRAWVAECLNSRWPLTTGVTSLNFTP